MGNFTDRLDGPASQSGPRRAASQELNVTPPSDRLPGCGCAMPCSAARRVQGAEPCFFPLGIFFFSFYDSLYSVLRTLYLFVFIPLKKLNLSINIVEKPISTVLCTLSPTPVL